MTIEIREKGSKDFYEETVNVISQYRGLIKKPEMKLRDRFKTLKIYIILCAALVVMLALMGIFWGMDTLTLVGIVFLAKDSTGMVISVNNPHSQEILDYLRSLNSSVRVIA